MAGAAGRDVLIGFHPPHVVIVSFNVRFDRCFLERYVYLSRPIASHCHHQVDLVEVAPQTGKQRWIS